VEREGDRLQRLQLAAQAEDLRLRFEVELWDIAKQLEDKKRCGSGACELG
jgi:hypothetical protein